VNPAVFIGVLAGLAIVGAIAWFWWRRASKTPEVAPSPRPSASPRAVSFGPKQTWLAVEASEPAEVIEALGAIDARRAGWEALSLAHGDRLFVTPPIDGFVLVVGALPDVNTLGVQSPALFLIRRLSRAVGGSAQYFCTHGGAAYHAWARADEGLIRRAYAYQGEHRKTLVDLGQHTTAEAFDRAFYDERSLEADAPGYWQRRDLRAPSDADVTLVAGGWSVDPTGLTERGDVGLGWLVEWAA